MKPRVFLLFLLALLSLSPFAQASEARVSTALPLYDYRAAPAASYQSLHLLGPFLKYETKGEETEYIFRPFFYRAIDHAGEAQTDFLYPLFGSKSDQETSSFHLFHLLNYDYGRRESGSRNRSYLFPFFFYGEEEQGRYAAFFPLGGVLYNWFGQDRIVFTLFPLYGHTEQRTTRVDHLLWPFFSRTSGDNESGYKFWPFYGEGHKDGVYRKKFFLWPFFLSQSTALDSDNPSELLAVWPFYVSNTSKESSSQTILWPFFSKTENYVKGYESWSLPWPLVRVTTGEQYHGIKIMPFFADETMDVKRQRWYLWPLYKIEEIDSELIVRRRDRICFFLF